MDEIIELFKTYTAALPTSVVAIILILIGLKLKRIIFKLIGLALVVAAVLFFVLKI